MTGVVDTRPTAIRALGRLERPRPDPAADGARADVQLDQLHASPTAGPTITPWPPRRSRASSARARRTPSPTPPSGFFNTPKGVSNYGLNMGDWFVFSDRRPGHARRLRAQPQPQVRQLHRRHQQHGAGQRGEDPQPRVQLRSAGPGATSTIPTTFPIPTADPFTVAPEYGGSCGAVGQGHTAWVDGNAQETGMTTAWPPNKQILGQNGRG